MTTTRAIISGAYGRSLSSLLRSAVVTVVLVVLAELVVVAWLSFLVAGVALMVVIVIVVLAVVVVGVSKFNTPSPNHKEEYCDTQTHMHKAKKFHSLLYTCIWIPLTPLEH